MEYKGGIADNTKKLVNYIIIVLVLLTLCVAVDSATNITVENNITDDVVLTDTVKINDTHYVVEKDMGVAKLNKVIVEKPKIPTITITSKPSCGCRHPYKWHTRTFINYCPYCHRYGTLTNLHKYPSKHEQEISCSRCRADFCGVCGKEKYSWSKVYLRRA